MTNPITIMMSAYPNSFVSKNGRSPISNLEAGLHQLCPPCVGLHILPFCPNSGDGGFAQDDWFSVEPTLGTIEELQKLAKRRNLYIDGIYNHVGKNHRLTKLMFNGNREAIKCFYVFPDNFSGVIPESLRESRRGGPVLRSFEIQGAPVKIWQTYPPDAFDINLDSEVISKEINCHIEFIKRVGAYGVRLDAPTTFGKIIGQVDQRHSNESIRLARLIATKIVSRNLALIAALDIDSENGQRYFHNGFGHAIQSFDYSYSLLLLYSVLIGDPTSLVAHVTKFLHLEPQPVRAPRTHDGLLLRTPNCPEFVKDWLIHKAKKHNAIISYRGGKEYELNSSFPFLLQMDADRSELHRRVELTLAVSLAIPGTSYFYLPYFMGFLSEESVEAVQDEPRSTNRARISNEIMLDYFASYSSKLRFSLLEIGHQFKKQIFNCNLREHYITEVLDRHLLRIELKGKGQLFYANFSPSKTKCIGELNKFRIDLASGLDGVELSPFGFAFASHS